jgi:hypothetical protein
MWTQQKQFNIPLNPSIKINPTQTLNQTNPKINRPDPNPSLSDPEPEPNQKHRRYGSTDREKKEER